MQITERINMKLSFVLLLLLFAFLHPCFSSSPLLLLDVLELFSMFKTEYNKRYTFIEEQEKLLVFWENLNEIRLLNEAAASEGGDRVEYGVTQFADMTVQEFKEKILMTATAPKIFEESRLLKLRENISDLPDNFDWRDHGAVTPVKD